jgi:glyoxylase-like metal-dependent hydrolase (beta-lactamase superfamily II)
MSAPPDPPPAIAFRAEMEFAYGVASEMATGIRRIVANNPGPFTYKGTNTYLLGRDTLAIVDPGPEDADHFAAVMAAVAGRPVSHIVLTHTHHDHFDGLPRLAEATGARVCGFGRIIARSPRARPSGGEQAERDFIPDIALTTGSAIEGPDWRLVAVHTPGHASDHLCLEVSGTGILLSGDHVMAWNTSVVAPPDGNMADYMASLEGLLARAGDRLYLPGHGGRLAEPLRMVKAFLVHRRWREQAILEAIRSGHRTISAVVGVVYRGIDDRLVRAASASVAAHVEHLISRGLVRADGPLTPDRPLAPA